jgi:hypothetical protein
MTHSPQIGHDWTALERSVAWLPWHRSTVALSFLTHFQAVDGSELADTCLRWLKAEGNLLGDQKSLNCSLLGMRLLVSLETTRYGDELASEIQLARWSIKKGLGNLRHQARSFLTALDLGQLNPDRAIWWMGSLIARATVPRNLRRKSPEHFARFSVSIDQFQVGLRTRDPAKIISSIREWIAIGEEDNATRPPI